MRKLFSIFTAMLAALAVSATPVVLPATLDVSNVSFRSEGMPDFVVDEGDYAGTYFDMGAHDSSNDTLLYAEWNVTIQPLKYNITVGVYNENSWSVRFHVLNQANEEVKTMYYKGHSGEKGKYAAGTIDMRDLAAGDYKIRVHAATAWSALKLKDVIFDADYSGATVALPGELLPAYAELSANASISNDAIAFKPSTAPDEYATWNVSFAKAGSFDVTIDMTASNGHNYGVALLSADGETEIGAVNEGGQKGDTGEKALGSIAVPAAGKYIVKLTNSIQWSEAVLNSITFAAPYEPAMKTIYCKMTQDWWTKDGAAVACYTWNDKGEPKAAWPGERMTPVEGETDVWSIELDVNTYHMCIFTRVNGTGDIADWGAKTKDLTIPTDDKDLFTIAAAEVWGDPGCEGEWSKFEASAPVEKKVIYDWAGEVGTTILGASSVEISTVKIHTNTDAVAAIKFGSSYVYAEGKWLAIKPAEGGFKAGDVLSVAAVFNNADDTKYAQIDLRAANGDTRIWLSDSASTINGRTKAGDPIVQTYTLEADQDSLFLGRYGNTGMFVTLLKVERAAGETPQPVSPIDHVYFATGGGWDPDNESSAVWDPETGKITVTLALAKVAAWQSQVFVNAVKAEPGKFYNFSVKMKANKNVNGATIKWQENNNDPIMVSEISTINLVADQEFVYSKEQIAGVDGNGLLVYDFGYAEAGTIIEIYDLVIEEAESAEHTYTVAGDSETAFGTTWDPTNTANDMIKLEDGTYKWEKTGLTLAAGDVKFKVCQDHDWAVAYPAQDYVLNIPEAGIYTITITYNPEGNVVAADAVKTGDAVVIPPVAMHGNFTGEWKDTENFTLAEGNATASLKLTIAAGNYEFGMRIGGSGNWTANGAAFSRESNSAVIESGQGNLKLAADVDGEYTFTWTYETNTLSIAFPTSTGISNTNADVKAVKLIENGQIVIIRNGEKFNVQGQVIR